MLTFLIFCHRFLSGIKNYSHLTESVKAFPNNENFSAILKQLNYKNTSFKTLSMGVAAIYQGEK